MKRHAVVRILGELSLAATLAASQFAVANCADRPDASAGAIGASGGLEALIVGVITDASKLCINGLPIQVDAQTAVSMDGKGAALGALAIGRVAVIAASVVGGTLKAARVMVFHEVIGPVTDVDIAGSELSVMGRRVMVRASARSLPGAAALESLKLGDVLRVSGLRDARGEIDGTRIDLAPASEPSVANGRLVWETEHAPVLAGVRLRFSDAVAASPDLNEKDVRITGRWTGRVLVVEDIVIDPLGAILDRTGRASLQGYLANDGSGISVVGLRVRISGTTRFDGGDRGSLRSDSEVSAIGAVRSGRQVDVERIRIAPPRPASSRGILLPFNASPPGPAMAR